MKSLAGEVFREFNPFQCGTFHEVREISGTESSCKFEMSQSIRVEAFPAISKN